MSETNKDTSREPSVSEQTFDPVNIPAHYNKKGLETIDVLRLMAEKFDDPWTSCLVYQIGKYLMRFEFKNGEQDLEKCIWYIKELANHRYPNSDLAQSHRRSNRPTSDEFKEKEPGAAIRMPKHCKVHGSDSTCNCEYYSYSDKNCNAEIDYEVGSGKPIHGHDCTCVLPPGHPDHTPCDSDECERHKFGR